MNTKQKIHQAKMAKWAVIIKEQSDSGLTVRQWCNEKGYTIHAYNYWKHLLKEEALKSISLPEIVPLQQPETDMLQLPASHSPSKGFLSKTSITKGTAVCSRTFCLNIRDKSKSESSSSCLLIMS
ncbi:hypothetical protein SAMN02910263_00611 [Butyrivibrio sp. INlla16]|nr:hypothetical protein [Butyrivibrio sp. INlla16]SDB13385.1 hypothetical protein SAMN02910263_00611 [Butyrivibrio sp. INlla16]